MKKTFMLVGMIHISGSTVMGFPKSLVVIEAETLEEAAEVLGGTLTDVGTVARGMARALFFPDVPCGKFCIGGSTPAKFVQAIEAMGVEPKPSWPLENTRRFLAECDMLLLGQVPSVT